MRFTTDDGEFGFIVTPVGGRHMFRFQLVMEGAVLGDAEPAILGSAMHQFSNLAEVDDTRLSAAGSEPSDILQVILHDDKIYDRVLLSAAESLDQWAIRGYTNSGRVVFVAQQYQRGELVGKVYSTILRDDQYRELIDAARNYWTTVTNRV